MYQNARRKIIMSSHPVFSNKIVCSNLETDKKLSLILAAIVNVSSVFVLNFETTSACP